MMKQKPNPYTLIIESFLNETRTVNVNEDEEGNVEIRFTHWFRSHVTPFYTTLKFNRNDPTDDVVKLTTTYHFPHYYELDGSELKQTCEWTLSPSSILERSKLCRFYIMHVVSESYFDSLFKVNVRSQYYYQRFRHDALVGKSGYKLVNLLKEYGPLGTELLTPGLNEYFPPDHRPFNINRVMYGKIDANDKGSDYYHHPEQLPNLVGCDKEGQWVLYRPLREAVIIDESYIKNEDKLDELAKQYLIPQDIKLEEHQLPDVMKALGLTVDKLSVDDVINAMSYKQDQNRIRSEALLNLQLKTSLTAFDKKMQSLKLVKTQGFSEPKWTAAFSITRDGYSGLYEIEYKPVYQGLKLTDYQITSIKAFSDLSGLRDFDKLTKLSSGLTPEDIEAYFKQTSISLHDVIHHAEEHQFITQAWSVNDVVDFAKEGMKFQPISREELYVSANSKEDLVAEINVDAYLSEFSSSDNQPLLTIVLSLSVVSEKEGSRYSIPNQLKHDYVKTVPFTDTLQQHLEKEIPPVLAKVETLINLYDKVDWTSAL